MAFVGKIPVDPHEVEFPETLIGHMHANGECAFQCGELSIPLPLAHSTLDKVNVFKTRHSAFLWPFTCLRTLGRDSEVPIEYKMATLNGADLRFSKYRPMIYEHLPFSMEAPYFEKQASLGLDFERLYSNS